ncbi:MAG: VWA domain-containing protein, partial [Spirochaetaceae bacterium]
MIWLKKSSLPLGRSEAMKKIFLSLSILALAVLAGFADGFIVVPEPVSMPGATRAFPLAVKYHHVSVEITDRTATTSIDQVFINPTGRRLEGEYIFPVPRGAVIKNFSMYIDGKETRAELLDAAKARSIYEEIVRKTLDPALLEYQNSTIFRVRIFPIEPNSEKRIKISYSEIIAKDNDTFVYLYPMNTEKFSSSPLVSASIAVNIRSQATLKSIFSTTHPVHLIRKDDNNAVASWEDKNVTPRTDFKLYFQTATSPLGMSILTHSVSGQDGYFLLDISPGFWDEKKEANPKDVIFVLDASGSMAGDKLAKAKEALRFCIGKLASQDRFQIIRFSTEAEVLFPSVVEANTARLKEASEYINRISAIGGTNVEDALTKAFSQNALQQDPNRLTLVVFITDGKPTIGEIDPELLAKKIGNANSRAMRIYTFGIDDSLDTVLLDKLTSLTRGYRAYVSPREDIASAIKDFYSKVEQPVLTDLKLVTSGSVRILKTHPNIDRLPDLFAGMSISVLGRYSGSGDAAFKLSGFFAGKSVSYTFEASFPKENPNNEAISSLWAARRVGFLLETIRTSGTSLELVEEVTFLARTYGIVTPYTSYLIIEDERTRVSRRELAPADQTMGGFADRDSLFEQRSMAEYGNLKKDSGLAGVQASEETQTL